MPDRWCALGSLETRALSSPGASEVDRPLALRARHRRTWCLTTTAARRCRSTRRWPGWSTTSGRSTRAWRSRSTSPTWISATGGLTLVVAGVARLGEQRGRAAHRCSRRITTRDGLDVIAQGTPTNNTDEAIAGWTADVADVAALFERELDDVGLAAPVASGAGQLARALGLADDTLLRRLPGAVADEDAAMAAMNRVAVAGHVGPLPDDLLAPEEGPSIARAAKRTRRSASSSPSTCAAGRRCRRSPSARSRTACCRSCAATDGDMHAPAPLFALEGDPARAARALARVAAGRAAARPGGPRRRTRSRSRCSALLPHPARFVIRRLTWQWDDADRRLGGALGGHREGTDLAALATIKLRRRVLPRDRRRASRSRMRSTLLELWRGAPGALGLEGRTPEQRGRSSSTRSIRLCKAHMAPPGPAGRVVSRGDQRRLQRRRVTGDPKIFFSSYSDPEVDELFTRGLVATTGHEPCRLPDRAAGAGGRRRGPGVAPAAA